jgi:hypothetical protein
MGARPDDGPQILYSNISERTRRTRATQRAAARCDARVHASRMSYQQPRMRCIHSHAIMQAASAENETLASQNRARSSCLASFDRLHKLPETRPVLGVLSGLLRCCDRTRRRRRPARRGPPLRRHDARRGLEPTVKVLRTLHSRPRPPLKVARIHPVRNSPLGSGAMCQCPAAVVLQQPLFYTVAMQCWVSGHHYQHRPLTITHTQPTTQRNSSPNRRRCYGGQDGPS